MIFQQQFSVNITAEILVFSSKKQKPVVRTTGQQFAAMKS